MNINEQEFLPQGVEFINKYRLQHGDIKPSFNKKGQMAEAKILELNVLENLYKIGEIITDYYHLAQQFRAMQEAYRAKWGSHVIMRYGMEKTGNNNADDDNKYLFIVRQLNKNEIDVLNNLFENKQKFKKYNFALEKLEKILLQY